MNEEDIFHQALARSHPEERAAYLEQACAGNPALRASVEALLRANVGASGFMDRPAPAPVITVEEPMSERPGAVIGPYKLLEQIGEGGFGIVFMAEQQAPIRRKVALKVLKPGMDSKQVIARFEAERQALALMDHPNIAKVHDGGATPSGRPYFVMDLVKGLPITEFCDQGQLTTKERLELFVHVCQAVQHAHQKGIIHRDLKPSNVLVTLQDGTPLVKVIDFGIAKALGQQLTDKTLFTGFAQMIGTPLYMSPEQAALSNVDVDTRSDIYSLGVLLYELLTGTTPFDKERLQQAGYDEMRRIIREEEPPRPSTRISTLGQAGPTVSAQRKSDPKRLSQLFRGELDWIVMKALDKDRNRRYETANAFALDVQRYLADEPVQACPPSAGYRVRKFVRRNKGPILAAALVLLALVVGVIGTTWQAVRATNERDDKQVALDQLNEEQQKTRAALAAETQARQQAMKALRTLTEGMVEEQLARRVTLSETERAFLNMIVAQWEAFAALRGGGKEGRTIQAEGHYRVGTLRARLGQRPEARASFERARELFRQLAKDFPDVPVYPWLLAASHGNLGDILGFLGKPTEAMAEYLQALPLLKQLTATFPNQPEYRQNLAQYHHSMGDLLYALGKRSGAEAEHQQSLALCEELVKDFPKEPGNRIQLARSHNRLGTLLRRLGKPAEAETELRRALAVEERLAGDFGVRDYRDRLAEDHRSLGMLLADRKRPQEAETELRRALVLFKELAADYPAVPVTRQSLAMAHNDLGNLLRDQGKPVEAMDELRQALSLQKRLADDFPREPSYAVELGGGFCNLGIVLVDSGKPVEALDEFQKAIQTLAPVVERESRLVTPREFLRNSHKNRAVLLMRLNRSAEAIKDWDRAIELDEGSQRASFRLDRALCLARVEPARAVAEVEELVQGDQTPAQTLYLAADVCALSSARVKDAARRETYAARAVALLQQARARGYFQEKANLQDLKKHSDFDSLRQREDFKKLLADLEGKKEGRLPAPAHGVPVASASAGE